MVPTSLPFLFWGRLSRSPSFWGPRLLSRFFFGGVCLGPPVSGGPDFSPVSRNGREVPTPQWVPNFSPVSFLGAFV